MNLLIRFLKVEEEIEKLYLFLIRMEISGQKYSDAYRYMMKRIDALTKEENKLLVEMEGTYLDVKKELQSYSVKEMPINLGFHTNASVLRFEKMIDSVWGDSGIEYADALYYDIHRILLKFLEYMIDNPYYENIRKDLISFKYDIIFLDYNVENDFLTEKDMSCISLDSRILQGILPSSKYIDQAILILEIEEAIKQIQCIGDVSEKTSSYTLVVIKMMQIFARMALCRNEELNCVMDDVQSLLEDEEIDFRVKEIMTELAEIFEQIQNSFYFSR